MRLNSSKRVTDEYLSLAGRVDGHRKECKMVVVNKAGAAQHPLGRLSDKKIVHLSIWWLISYGFAVSGKLHRRWRPRCESETGVRVKRGREGDGFAAKESWCHHLQPIEVGLQRLEAHSRTPSRQGGRSGGLILGGWQRQSYPVPCCRPQCSGGLALGSGGLANRCSRQRLRR
jgi:hypothetical protein